MKRVYVAGPYTHGDVAVNVREAMEAGIKLIDAGFAPFVPHLSHFLHMMKPQDYGTWMELDEAYIIICHALVRLPGHSPGADSEERFARSYGIPVFYGVEDFLHKEGAACTK